MSITVAPATTFEAVCTGFASGLTGTIGVRILDNAGATTTSRVTAGIAEYPSGSGIYYVSLTAPATAGQYSILWDNGSTTPGNIATEDLVVTPGAAAVLSATATEYITSSELKATLTLTGETFADADITVAISAACRAIDEHCGRRFYEDDTGSVRYYTTTTPWLCMTDDFSSVSSVAIDTTGSRAWGTSLTTTHYTPIPYNASAESNPYEALEINPQSAYTFPATRAAVKVTAVWGWPAVPAPVKNATTILAGRYLKRAREAPFGIAGFGIDGNAVRISRIDPDIAMLLDPYKRVQLLA